MEVINHHGNFLLYGIAVTLHKIAEFLMSALLVKHRIVLDGLHQFVEAVDGRVILKHIKDKSLLNGLLHRVHMERAMSDILAVLI